MFPTVLLLTWVLTQSQPLPGLQPALTNRQEDSLINDRYRRGFITDNAINDEKIDQTTLRRAHDRFANVESSENSAKIGHGYLDGDGLFTSSHGKQGDSQRQEIDRGSFANDHLGVSRSAADLTNAHQETGSRVGRRGYRSALGGPFQMGEYADDMAVFDRVDDETSGRQTDYVKDADRSMTTFDRGVAKKNAAAEVTILQDGARGGASKGTEEGSADTERVVGAVAKQSLLEKGRAVQDLSRRHDAIGNVNARRAGTAFGPDGSVAANVITNQEGWDRGNLDHTDSAEFLHAAHDHVVDVEKERSKADVGVKVTIGNSVPGDVESNDRLARHADGRDRVVERDVRDRLMTNADSTTMNTFDIGGKTLISDAGISIGIPAVA